MTMKTRQEHLEWCKVRARTEMDFYKNAPWQGVISMMSDLRKHPDTAGHTGITIAAQMLANGKLKSRKECLEFINGFN